MVVLNHKGIWVNPHEIQLQQQHQSLFPKQVGVG
jgi:hypothetical protein